MSDREEQIIAWRKNIPDLFHGSYRRKYDKAMSHKSIRAAIDSKCLDCMCWEAAEVKKCGIVTCPLHPYRPYQPRQTKPVASNLAPQQALRAVGSER